MVISLKHGTDSLHRVKLMPLHPQTPSSLASFKSTLVLPFCYRLTEASWLSCGGGNSDSGSGSVSDSSSRWGARWCHLVNTVDCFMWRL